MLTEEHIKEATSNVKNYLNDGLLSKYSKFDEHILRVFVENAEESFLFLTVTMINSEESASSSFGTTDTSKEPIDSEISLIFMSRLNQKCSSSKPPSQLNGLLRLCLSVNPQGLAMVDCTLKSLIQLLQSGVGLCQAKKNDIHTMLKFMSHVDKVFMSNVAK